jgi:hypothetical protein
LSFYINPCRSPVAIDLRWINSRRLGCFSRFTHSTASKLPPPAFAGLSFFGWAQAHPVELLVLEVPPRDEAAGGQSFLWDLSGNGVSEGRSVRVNAASGPETIQTKYP